MKASEFLKQWLLTGAVPDGEEGEESRALAFWCGWLIGPSHSLVATTSTERLEMAIKAAEFIESRV